MSYTIDDTTVAAIPGELSISPKKFLDYVGVTGFKKFIYGQILLLPNSILYSLLRSNSTVSNWITFAEHFKYGCANPAIIINREKELVAVFTNLSNTGNNPTPVIKIYREKLHLIQGQTTIGQRISTVATYYRNPKQWNAEAWIDFDPKVPDCFTENLQACSTVLNNLSSNSWKCLEIGLAQLNNCETPGLYHVEIDNDMVNSSY